MPVYDYHCATCGPFESSRPMKESSEPAACPQCAALTARVLVAPSLNLMQASTRKAEIRNEKSANAPEVVSRIRLTLRTVLIDTTRRTITSDTSPRGPGWSDTEFQIQPRIRARPARGGSRHCVSFG